MVFLQCAMAPCMALCSSSMDEEDDETSAGGVGGPLSPPVMRSSPECVGEDLIDDGQLPAHLFLLGNFKLPEKEWEWWDVVDG